MKKSLFIFVAIGSLFISLGVNAKDVVLECETDLLLLQPEKKVMSIVTDSTPVADPKDHQKCNVYTLYSLFASEEEKKLLAEKYQAGGMGYGEAKKSLLGKINTYFEAARIKRKELAAKPDVVEEILREGARKARAEARATIDLVRDAVGMKNN